MTLLEELVSLGKINKEQANSFKKAAKTSNKREEEIILEKKIVPEIFLFDLISKRLNIPLKKVSSEDISLRIMEMIPEDSVRFYKMIPLSQKDNFLEIGMVYPEDLKAREALNFLSRQSKFSFEVYLITQTDLNILLRKYKSLKKEVREALEEIEVEKPKKTVKKEEIKRMAEKAPISKIVSVMIRHAVEGGASDIHIEPFKDKLRIRYRTLGNLFSSLSLPKKVHPAVVARIKILSDLRIDETRIPQDGRFSIKIEERRIDFRVSTLPTSSGEKVVIRILDPKKSFRSFEKLGLEGRNYESLEKAIKRPYGLILATGPTGSGKTTTLYAILKVLNTEAVNITTLEDPIEYHMEGINQSQVKPDIGYTFANGLRHIMRQDPDIIMVGEIRDEETANLAIHSALTGHLVLSTLHTNNAIGVIPRLVDMGIQPFLISPTLTIAIAQRLVRVLCPDCKKKVEASPEIKEMILKDIKEMPDSISKKVNIPSPLYLYKSQGCKKCNSTGFIDQIALYEVLNMTPELGQLILKTLAEPDIEKEAKKQERISMRQDGILKVLDGITTIEEVLRVTK